MYAVVLLYVCVGSGPATEEATHDVSVISVVQQIAAVKISDEQQ